jgi:transcriptional regulator with XRE-family HTH domain
VSSRPREGSSTSSAVAEKVQSILASKGLTLYRASQQSIKLYGRTSPYFLPHNLYYDLRKGSFRPSVHQIFALSRISGHRAADWLRVFGFDLEDIPRLQILLPSKRTLVLDTSLTASNEWIPWPRNRPIGEPIPSITPLARLLELGPRRRIASVSKLDQHFVYAKVGGEDAFAFPDLAPRSIVRVNTNVTASLNPVPPEKASISDHLFLVEHSNGFLCCRIRILGGGIIVPFDNGLSYAQVELRCPQEAKLWGAVDLEFRPLLHGQEPNVPKDLARLWKPQPFPVHKDFGDLLKSTRTRMKLSIREAAAMSRKVAEVLKDDRYRTAPSSLSDYEMSSTPPRDFRKVITLCSIYGLQFRTVMERMGVDLDDAGAESMPDRYFFRAEPTVAVTRGRAEIIGSGFLEKVLEEYKEIPLFLRDSLGYFSSSASVSLDDFFWVGGDDDPLHPYLAKASLVMVNRRRKTPLHFASKAWWQQPLYVILMRDGSYLACCCAVESGLLVIHPYSLDFHRSAQYRLHQDAEVVGQIVAIMRRVP